MPEQQAHDEIQTQAGSMRTSRFDSVTSFLMACILMLGCVVTGLFVVWMADEVDSEITLNKPAIRMMTSSPGVNIEPKFDVPKLSEVRDITEPSVETRFSFLKTPKVQVKSSTDATNVSDSNSAKHPIPGHSGVSSGGKDTR